MSKKKVILHIDDDVSITSIAGRILGFSGYDVKSYNALEEIPPEQWKECDLIILDWMLPGTNALKVYDVAKANNFKGEALILTARDITDRERLQLSDKNIYYMRKPFGPSSLISMITEIFARA